MLQSTRVWSEVGCQTTVLAIFGRPMSGRQRIAVWKKMYELIASYVHLLDVHAVQHGVAIKIPPVAGGESDDQGETILSTSNILVTCEESQTMSAGLGRCEGYRNGHV